MKTAGVLLTWEIEDQKWATKINMNHHESKIKTYQDLFKTLKEVDSLVNHQ